MTRCAPGRRDERFLVTARGGPALGSDCGALRPRAGRELAEMVADGENGGPADLYADVPSFDQMLGGM
ncbi:hypothetical protein [Georgenia sp. SYP-B2076]|uniref:hypothetical protein n=1 Tax=Georgenia sp. SYP-B2076 TaxID=2495881 RepID=UPI000F8D80E0|nr:hypothetical protein [Georgenia sp. SYP-B2076]